MMSNLRHIPYLLYRTSTLSKFEGANIFDRRVTCGVGTRDLDMGTLYLESTTWFLRS